MIDFNLYAMDGIDIDKLKEVREFYNEPHRFYHTWDHITEMLEHSKQNENISDIMRKALHVAILYHDAIYIVGADDNELASAEVFKSHHGVETLEKRMIYDAILSTKDHVPTSILSTWLIDADLHDLRHPTIKKITTNTYNIYQENKDYCEDWNAFVKANLEFLISYKDKIGDSITVVMDIVNSIPEPELEQPVNAS